MRRRRGILYRTVCVLLVLLAAALAGLVWWLRSSSFRQTARAHIEAELRRATGPGAELKSVEIAWSTLAVTLTGLRVPSPAGEPLLEVDRAVVDLQYRQLLFHSRVGLDAVLVDGFRLRLVETGGGGRFDPKKLVGDAVRMVLGRLELRNGDVEFRSGRLDVALRASDVTLGVTPAADRAFQGMFSAGSFEWLGAAGPRAAAVVDAAFTLREDGLQWQRITASLRRSSLAASGELKDWSQVQLKWSAQVAMEDAADLLQLPLERRGWIRVTGDLQGPPVELQARLEGEGLAWQGAGIRVEPVHVSAHIRAAGGRLDVEELRASLLGGSFLGQAGFREGAYELSGSLTGVSTRELRLRDRTGLRWNGTVAGPLRVTGSAGGAQMEARLAIQPQDGEIPLGGALDFRYGFTDQSVQVQEAHFEIGASRLHVAGSLNQGRGELRLGLISGRLDDLAPVWSLFSSEPAPALPVSLRDGRLLVNGSVSGSLEAPHFGGRVLATNLVWRGRLIESVRADVGVNGSELKLADVRVDSGAAQLRGDGELALLSWKPQPNSTLRFTGKVRQLALKDWTADAPVPGVAAVNFDATGTLDQPRFSATGDVMAGEVAGERFERLHFQVRGSPEGVELISAEITGPGRWRASGRWSRAPAEGDSVLEVALEGERVALRQLRAVRQSAPDVDGLAAGKLRATVWLRERAWRLAALDGAVALRALRTGGEKNGNADVTLETRGRILTVQAKATLGGASIEGTGAWPLDGEYSGQGTLRLAPVSIAALMALQGGPGASEDETFEGTVGGELLFRGSPLDRSTWRGTVRVDTLQLRPGRGVRGNVGDLTLANEGPILAQLEKGFVRIERARLLGKHTVLNVSGIYDPADRRSLSLSASGTVNLAILRTFRSDILASGQAQVQATIRGDASRPLITGRVVLKEASLFVEDLPAGIEKVNGILAFDRNRVTIVDSLAADLGGGRVKLSGFVSFARDELVYRLQADGQGMRVRYPEGVSTTMDASLSLTGTSQSSILAGTVNVQRFGFTGGDDLGGLLASSNRPISAPVSSNVFLRGMQLDIRVATGHEVEFQSVVTRQLQVEAALQLRGSPVRPVVLGRITANRGEISFFGNRYRINRGEILFYNTNRVEPVLDLDLETRARAVLITINFSGPINKLNISYRSDPPLDSAAILNLLTVGRSPDAAGTLATPSNQGFVAGGANSLLGQALSAPISGRLQRFFGVSRLKLDPQMTGLDGTPQPRLTIEQQVNENVTLTLVSNLARSQQQQVRLEWDVSREWSIVAVRDENGVVGVDFFFKRRFR